MDKQTLAGLCRLYGLGTPIAPPERVWGGLLHRMYRVQTARGGYAVKVLNPTVMQYHNVRARFRLSERIAAAVAAANIPAVPALEAAGDVIQDVGRVSVMVFLWVNAQALSAAPASQDQARQIGQLLGRIHALPLHCDGLQPPDWQSHANDEADWAFLVDEAGMRRAAWAEEVRSALPDIAAWIRASQEARQALGGKWAISHSDLDQKNVLWSDEHTPWLIDWEAAGYVQPVVEAAGTALNWAGQAAGVLDIAAFKAFLEGYRREAALSAHEVKHGLQAYCGDWCGWLKYNMQRSLGLATTDPEEQALGTREAVSTLMALRSAAANIPALVEQYGQAGS